MLNKILIAVIIIILLAGGGYYLYTMQQDKDTTVTPAPTPPPVVQVNPLPPPPAVSVPDKALAKFETSAGNFEITLNGKAAPLTVANFIKRAEAGDYNGTKFFRVIKGFMIQGGDPNTKEADASTYGLSKKDDPTIPAEIGLLHNEGAISMARTGDAQNPTKASSNSQFFIVLEESVNNHNILDGGYSAFGYVTKGMDIVKKIGNAPTKDNPYSGERASLPLTYIVINKVTIQEIK